MQNIFQTLENNIHSLFFNEATGHDFFHLKRVYLIAKNIHKVEGGDFNIIGAAALTHDIHRLIQVNGNKYCSPKESLPMVEDILKRSGFPDKYISNVLHCVEYHEEYSFTQEGKTVDDIETLILQDADNLDSIGAIGVARTFAYGGANGEPMYDPNHKIVEQVYDDSVIDHSVIHHFHNKLLRLYKDMNTETGKELAKKRHDFMLNFLEQFMDEWEGRK